MCGINGFTFEDKNLAQLMNECTKHRGPDGSNIWMAPGITFGHNRLSILDVSSASSQPMLSKDGRYAITYNGELYNFQDIKKELSDVKFISKGDTEVILEAYIKWGKECVYKFNGMFALAIWDTKEKTLFLARDHAGIKPLYYSEKNGKFIFSSEIKGILSWTEISKKLSLDSLNHYFRLLYVPEPLTMFTDIFKFPQGSYGFFKNEKLSIEKYYNDSVSKTKASEGEIVKDIKKKVEDAVERQLISDRPVGVYLSGGIDSSVILDCVSKRHEKIKTFSVGFSLGNGEEANKYNKDIDLARETAKRYKTEHHEVLISSDDVMKSLKEVVYQMDEPISNPTACALFALSKATKGYADVVLCGDGGDELFAGYERYRLGYIATQYQRLPSFITNMLSKVHPTFAKLAQRNWIDRYSQFLFQKDKDLQPIFSKDILKPKITADFMNQYMKGSSFEEAILNTDRKTWLIDFALMLSDTMSMSHGVEARVPFLDKEVIDYALSIPVSKKFSFFTNKKLLKKAFAADLPEYLLKQPKRGFFTPAAKWLRHPEFLAMAREILSPQYALNTSGLFNWEEVSKMLEDHVTKKKYNLSIIWALMTFQIWAKRFDVKL